ncbi:MAG: hypothetical protein BroJett024_35040 [Alphaproteobacteria bacterium]|nr:MAG: hypothetical protein BroJett024_35040 [Alphaproteobacteria bacterium]
MRLEPLIAEITSTGMDTKASRRRPDQYARVAMDKSPLLRSTKANGRAAAPVPAPPGRTGKIMDNAPERG